MVLATAVGGCNIGVGNFAGKLCETANDCPEPYTCLLARPGQGRTCELLRGPEIRDGGNEAPAEYCADIRPVLQRTCVLYCHGADNSGSAQSSFRLDQYANLPDGGLGAAAKSARVKVRTDLDDMPPSSPPGLSHPTLEEREAIGRWATAGAPFLLDGGGATECPDGGT